jgi:hypothetical protein
VKAWGAYGAWNPSSGDARRHDVSEDVKQAFGVRAGQDTISAAQQKRPQQDSNLRTRLRRPMLYPLSYGGYATQERVPAADT